MPTRVPSTALASTPPSRGTLDAFVAQHLALAFAVAGGVAQRKGIRDEHVVVEAAHVGVTEAWRAVEGREDRWSPELAVRTVTERRMLDLVRRVRARAKRSGPLGEIDCVAETTSPVDAAERSEVRASVRAALAELTPEQRSWVEAFVAHGKTEGARALGIPKSTLCSRLAVLRARLERRLRSIAMAGLVLALGAGLVGEAARTGWVHAGFGPFAVQGERPTARATIEEFRAEAVRFRRLEETIAARDVEARVERGSAVEVVGVVRRGAGVWVSAV